MTSHEDRLVREVAYLEQQLEEARAQVDWLRLQYKEATGKEPEAPPRLRDDDATRFLERSFAAIDTMRASPARTKIAVENTD